jgi:hypothetical protein
MNMGKSRRNGLRWGEFLTRASIAGITTINAARTQTSPESPYRLDAEVGPEISQDRMTMLLVKTGERNSDGQHECPSRISEKPAFNFWHRPSYIRFGNLDSFENARLRD